MKYTHIILRGNDLYAIVAPIMEHYVIDDDGVECYHAALKQAIADGVKFKDAEFVYFVVFGYESDLRKIEKNKPYPIPDGYSIETKECDCKDCAGTDCRFPYGYAILVPKETPEQTIERSMDFDCGPLGSKSKEKGAGEDYPVIKCVDMTPPIVGENGSYSMTFKSKQQSIEEAAWQSYRTERLKTMGNAHLWDEQEAKENFIAGAKSQAAETKKMFEAWNDHVYKGYYVHKVDLETVLETFDKWYEQFKQEL